MERIAKMNIADSKRIWMSTFHAMCARIMWSHAQCMGYDDNLSFMIWTTRSVYIKSLIKELGLNDKYFTNQFLV